MGADVLVDWGMDEGGVMEFEEGRACDGVSHRVMECRRSGVPVLPYLARSNAAMKRGAQHNTLFIHARVLGMPRGKNTLL